MPEQDLVLENWNAAVDAARDAVKSAGINPPLAKQHALRALAETAARAVFAKAKADVKTVRATIAWGTSPLDVKLEVITAGRQRYPRDAEVPHSVSAVVAGSVASVGMTRAGATSLYGGTMGLGWEASLDPSPPEEFHGDPRDSQ